MEGDRCTGSKLCPSDPITTLETHFSSIVAPKTGLFPQLPNRRDLVVANSICRYWIKVQHMAGPLLCCSLPSPSQSGVSGEDAALPLITPHITPGVW